MGELVSGGINKWLMFQSWISFQILQKIWIRMIRRMAFEICKKWFKRKYQSPSFAWVKAGEKDPFISKQAQCACTFNFQLTVKNEVDLWTLTAVWRQPFTWNDMSAALSHPYFSLAAEKQQLLQKPGLSFLTPSVRAPLPAPRVRNCLCCCCTSILVWDRIVQRIHL